MFGMLQSLTKAAISIAVLPVDIAFDVATLGGSLTDKEEPYTVDRLKDFKKNLDKALDPNG